MKITKMISYCVFGAFVVLGFIHSARQKPEGTVAKASATIQPNEYSPTSLGKQIVSAPNGFNDLNDPRPAWNFEPTTKEQRDAVEAERKVFENRVAVIRKRSEEIRIGLPVNFEWWELCRFTPLRGSSHSASEVVFHLSSKKCNFSGYTVEVSSTMPIGPSLYWSPDGKIWNLVSSIQAPYQGYKEGYFEPVPANFAKWVIPKLPKQAEVFLNTPRFYGVRL